VSKDFYAAVLFILLIFALSISSSIGSYEAKHKTDFIVCSNNIVIGEYKNKLIVKEFNEEDLTLKISYKLIEINDNLIFEKKDIGILKPQN